MATYTERLELLITGQSTDAVAALNKTSTATEALTGKQKAMSVASSGAASAMQGLGIPAEATGAALKVAAVGAGALAAVKLGEWAKGAADEWAGLAGEIRTFQRASGTSAEEASRWVAVLDDMEIATDTGAKAVFKMSRELGQGGTALAEFGVQVAENDDGTTDLTGTLLNVADAYGEMTDDTEKAALVQAAFGRAGAELIPILEKGRKGLEEFFEGAEEGHQIMTADDIAKAREYELALDDLGDTMRGLKLEVGSAVAPTITRVADALSESIEVVDDAAGAFGGLGNVVSKGIDFTPIGSGLHTISAFSKLAEGDVGGFAGEVAHALPIVGGFVGLFDDAEEATDTYTSATERLKTAQSTMADLAIQGKTHTKEYADASRDAAAAENEVDTAVRKVTGALTDEALAQYQVQQGMLVAAAAGVDYQSKLLAVADAVDKKNALIAAGQSDSQTAAEYNNDLAQSDLAVQSAMLAVIDAAGKKAQADADTTDKTKLAKAATEGQNTAILALAASTPGATEALAKMGYVLVTMPDGKTIVMNAETAQAQRNLENLTQAYKDYLSVTGGNPRAYYSPAASTTSLAAPAAVAAPVGMRALSAAPAALADGTPVVATPAPMAAAPSSITFNVNVTTRGLGADAPEIQRAVVNAVRGYVARNGRLEGVTR